MTFSPLKQGEHFILPPWYFRIKHNRRIKKQKKKCWRDEKKKLSRAIDSGIALDPVCYGAFRKSYKIQIGRLKSMIRNHGNEYLHAPPGPFTFEDLRAGAMKSEKLGGWSPWALAREFAELKKWEEETLLIINRHEAPMVKLIGMAEDT